jgi:hypothetical protein
LYGAAWVFPGGACRCPATPRAGREGVAVAVHGGGRAACVGTTVGRVLGVSFASGDARCSML